MPLKPAPIQQPIAGTALTNPIWVRWFTQLANFLSSEAVVLGVNADSGIATLTAGGVAVVSAPLVTATSEILLTGRGGNVANLGVLYVSSVTPGVSFTVQSTNILDLQTFSWMILGG